MLFHTEHEKRRPCAAQEAQMQASGHEIYPDGKKPADIVQAALDNNMMVDDLKKQLIRENPGHTVTFKVE